MQERGLWLKYSKAEVPALKVGSIRVANQSNISASKSADRSKLIPAGKPTRKEEEDTKNGRRRAYP